ncbi:MAG: ATP-binding protein [Euryarchaeota archaeon]|nr:ATP-binding protein [Euryarchaeota archaeon]MBU4071206.1 ATP-binding protein [Candidatus Thermoplasmatota archaeon]MBU4144601.1 ATP-binding protein [Candidatus Thermoplasmatota archaeon]
MTDITTLKEILGDGKLLLDQEEALVERDMAGTLLSRAKYGVIEVVTGVRRAGKSKLLLWVGRQLRKEGKNVYYINFEDDRFMPGEKDLQNIATLIELDNAVLLVDEPQNMPNWEKWVRRMHDRGIKIYVTGSNSKLLGSEFATALTGRKKEHEVFPFSFSEFLKSKNAVSLPSDQNIRMFEDYMTNGGYPYSVISGDNSVLSDYRRDIIERDILARHKIRDVNAFKNLYRFVMSNPGLYISQKSIKGFIDISHVTLRKYLDYLVEAYAVIPLEKFSYSQKEQLLNPRKFYPIDNGLLIRKTDLGKLLESCMVQHIKRHTGNVFYWKDSGAREVDVYLPDRNLAIQVCYELNVGNLSREEKALESAVDEFNAKPLIVSLYSEAKSKYPTMRATEFIENIRSIVL